MDRRNVVKLTREEIANLRHAIMHLEANHIETSYFEGWFCGNKAQFIKRHIKAKAMLIKWLEDVK